MNLNLRQFDTHFSIDHIFQGSAQYKFFLKTENYLFNR
jgi:hypothetical protein